ncbi:GtrA family protein [Halomicroarcula sp. GCM10025817]|uniref:GtrA family protein n=1 Tax=Haloarcula TaxID=2237 RepID=UPI0023E774F8|nr:GtrA family protein [Halomicroarcula sp. SYNS111]
MTGRLARLRGAVPDRFEALVSGVRFGQFVSVGVVGALCDTTVLVVLTEVFGVLPEIATILGIETAILVMFAINDNWTFDAEGDHRSLGRRLLRSHAVRAGGSTTQFVVFVVVYRLLFVPLSLLGLDLWLLVAKAGGIGVGMFVNYVFESLFTWQVHRSD